MVEEIEEIEEIKSIIKDKKLTSFWRVFDFLKLAGYDETTAIMTGLKISNGEVWGDVVGIVRWYREWDEYDIEPEPEPEEPPVFIPPSRRVLDTQISFSGSTYLHAPLNGISIDTSCISPVCSEFWVEISLMTKEADKIYLPVYEAYVETSKYAFNETLDKHVETIKIKLETEVGMSLIKQWKKNI